MCRCGQTRRGDRQARHQVVACEGCARKLLVLPRSPLDLPTGPERLAQVRWWRAPLSAALLCLMLVIAAFLVWLPMLTRPAEQAGGREPRAEGRTARQEMAQAQVALAEGKFQVARRLFDQALVLHEGANGPLTAAQLRALGQYVRQAELLATLSPRSLEEIVRHAKLVRDPEEWDLQFADYRGRSFVFDDQLRRDGLGRPALANYVVEVDDEPVRLALEEVAVLQDLALDDGPRVVFGARLARVAREQGGWVARFVPESGVLVTDRGALEACFAAADDNDLTEALARQQRWLDERAAPRK